MLAALMLTAVALAATPEPGSAPEGAVALAAAPETGGAPEGAAAVPARNMVFVSPFGGYAPVNYNKKVDVLDPDGKATSVRAGDLSSPLLDLIRRSRSSIDIACYIYGTLTPEHEEILRANARGVRIRLFLDPSIKDKNGVPIVNEVLERLKTVSPPIPVKIVDPKRAEALTGLPFETMHEKFGIIDRTHVFTGSANIETNANVKYTEDRFFFLDNPAMVAVFQGEFDRLWDGMGRWMLGSGEEEAPPSASASAPAPAPAPSPPPASGGIDIRFNSVERLEKYVKGVFSEAVARSKAGGKGTIDIMIFSFTSLPLADSLLRIARDYPEVRIRILANLSQLFREPTSVLPDMEGIVSGKTEAYRAVAERRKAFIKSPEERAPAVEAELKQIVSEYRGKPIGNVELRYKWFPAFSWDVAAGKPDYDHFHPKAALLHHKSAIVNGETLVTGSYNWSNYAETKNLENLMIVRGAEDRKLIDDFAAEFEAMWNDPAVAKPADECRALKEKACAEIIRERAAKGAPAPPR